MNKDSLLIKLDIILNSDDKEEIDQHDLYYSDEIKIYEKLVRYACSLIENAEPDDLHTINKCIKLFNCIADMGKNNVVWNYHIGYAYYLLDKFDRAEQYLNKTLELIKDSKFDLNDSEISFYKEEAKNLIDECNYAIDKENLEVKYLQDQLNKEKALDYVIHCILPQYFKGVATQRRGNGLHIFEKDLTVSVSILDLTNTSAVIHFDVYKDSWSHHICDCFVGTGQNTNEALSLSVQTFIETLYDGVSNLLNGQYIDEFSTKFVDKEHKFFVYCSNILSVGDCPVTTDNAFFYLLLKDEIKQRVGNQSVVCISIFTSKEDDNIVTECRINDKLSFDLANIISEHVKKTWKNQDFSSKKLYILIEQDESTLIQNPYQGYQGFIKIKSRIKTIVKEMYARRHDHDEEALKQALYEKIDDKTLVDVALIALPEICAKDAYSKIRYPEYIYIQKDGVSTKYYLSQFTDVEFIESALFELFDESAFDDKTNKIYRYLISNSQRFKEYGDYLDNGIDISNKIEPLYITLKDEIIR